MDWKTFLLSADGRISRQSFWIGFLIVLGANVLVGWIPLIGWIVSLVSIYVLVCLGAKRLHDFGRSGWLQVIPFAGLFLLVLAVAMIVGTSAATAAFSGDDDAINAAVIGGVAVSVAASALAFLISAAFLLWVGLTPGQPGANKYGEPPPANPFPAAT